MFGLTLTGIDERTHLDAAKLLAHDGAELGILLTLTPEGRNRYPASLTWIASTLAALKVHGKTALHVCGSKARDALVRGNLGWVVEAADRVQINGPVSLEELEAVCGAHPDKTIITQYPMTASLAISDRVEGRIPNHAWLVDGSGGKGKLPTKWTRPETDKPVGFAGGLGPANLHIEVPKIQRIAKGEWWVDMEGKLRNEEDWFDVQRARQVLVAWKALTK